MYVDYYLSIYLIWSDAWPAWPPSGPWPPQRSPHPVPYRCQRRRRRCSCRRPPVLLGAAASSAIPAPHLCPSPSARLCLRPSSLTWRYTRPTRGGPILSQAESQTQPRKWASTRACEQLVSACMLCSRLSGLLWNSSIRLPHSSTAAPDQESCVCPAQKARDKR
jgi:hypothetical protein